jgi:hypothetical protein
LVLAQPNAKQVQMQRFFIDHHCNGHTARDLDGVELDSVEEAGAYAVGSSAQVFRALVPGERRKCAFEVRDDAEGWLLKIDLTLCLEQQDRQPDPLDTGLL